MSEYGHIIGCMRGGGANASANYLLVQSCGKHGFWACNLEQLSAFSLSNDVNHKANILITCTMKAFNVLEDCKKICKVKVISTFWATQYFEVSKIHLHSTVLTLIVQVYPDFFYNFVGLVALVLFEKEGLGQYKLKLAYQGLTQSADEWQTQVSWSRSADRWLTPVS